MNTAAGFVGHLSYVQVDYALMGAVTAMAIAGSFAGSRLANRVEPGSLRRSFAVFVAAMGVVILVREADVWITTARDALPNSGPQVVFAVLMLLIGIMAGRATRRAPRDPTADRLFSDGGGI